MPRGEFCTSEVQGHSGKAANRERKHGSNACTHQSEMQLEGDFIARDLWCTSSTGIALKYLTLPSFMNMTFSAGVIAGRYCRLSCLLESHPLAMYRKIEFASAKVFLKSQVKDDLASSGEDGQHNVHCGYRE